MDKPIQVLVVSSESTNCDALKDIINREGWKLFWTTTVRESREVLAQDNFNLVFSDRGLADGTYRDVLVAMRLLGLCIPMIVTSRLADWDEYLEAVHDGAFDLIASPSRPADLVRAISQVTRPLSTATALPRTVGPYFTVSKSRSIERYPSMTKPHRTSPQERRTED